jgi:hypothetical protein
MTERNVPVERTASHSVLEIECRGLIASDTENANSGI